MAKERNFPAVFAELKSVLQQFAPYLTVKQDTTDGYSLDGLFSPKYNRDVFFGSVQIKKNYVSFYLMPVYIFPELLDGISERLSKRMQGKSCFNFTTRDAEIVGELNNLVEKGFQLYRQEHLVKES